MLLNYILPFTNKKIIKYGLLFFQNIYTLFICYQSLTSIYDWRNTGNIISLLNTTKYLRIYLLTDLLLCSGELYIHHIASLCIIHVAINNPIFFNTNLIFYTSILYGTELSTLFLCVKCILKEQYDTQNNYVDIIFLTTFIYTRIYLFSKYLILDK